MGKDRYTEIGVDYNAMDPFKRECQLVARETAQNIERFGFQEVEGSRGESAYLIDIGDAFLAHVEEGLGTKNLVADAMNVLTGKSYYDQIAQCAVAMIVNDIITQGALPISIAMHLAVGSSEFFNDQKRTDDLIKGWKKACDLAGCVWAGGETPTLKDIVMKEAAVLNGSCLGIIKPKDQRICGNIEHGDAIFIFPSSGIHANGLSLAREVAKSLSESISMALKLSKGYLTPLDDGRMFGEALLDPTLIYVPLIAQILRCKIPIHYAVNVTGHGWRKLMRHPGKFVYIIDKIPQPQPVFSFIQKYGQISTLREMYGTFNMGAGFALYLPDFYTEKVMAISKELNFKVIKAGYVEKTSGDKKVIIRPLQIEFSGQELNIR